MNLSGDERLRGHMKADVEYMGTPGNVLCRKRRKDVWMNQNWQNSSRRAA